MSNMYTFTVHRTFNILIMSNKTMSNREKLKSRLTLEMPKVLRDRLENAKRKLSVERSQDVSVGGLLCEGADELLKKFGL